MVVVEWVHVGFTLGWGIEGEEGTEDYVSGVIKNTRNWNEIPES